MGGKFPRCGIATEKALPLHINQPDGSQALLLRLGQAAGSRCVASSARANEPLGQRVDELSPLWLDSALALFPLRLSLLPSKSFDLL